MAALAAWTAPSREVPLPDSSLYHLESSWQRDDGKAMTLAALRGKPRIFSMFFSRCDNICPMLMGQLKALEREMPPGLLAKSGFVLVSLDSEADTPEVLRAYRASMDLPPEAWLLLRGNADDVRELALLLDVRFAPKDKDGQIPHTGLVALLDAEGRVLFKAPNLEKRKEFLQKLGMAVGAKK